MEIPLDQLRPETLRALIEELVTREGTDYGCEVDLEDKVAQVMGQLRRGEAVVTFDPESETTSIVAT